MGELKLLSLFSGIGAFEKALENIGEPFEVVRYCEIDKYASKAYSLIHNLDENMNLKDIKDVDTDELPDNIDLVTYGFPCQDISNAGKQKGFVHDGELTRSGLFFEALRIIEDTQPKIAICENVKALTSKKFKTEFKIVMDSLNDAGYKNYWAVLNAKDYGIPQNRERVFIISIRNDIDHGFEFPEKYELKLRLKDLLEDNVDEKFYLSDEQVRRLTGNVFNSANRRVQEKDYFDTLIARDYKDPRLVNENAVKQIGNIVNTGNWDNPQRGRIYSPDGCSPALNCCGGGGLEPKIIQVGKINSSQDGVAVSEEGVSPTHTAGHGNMPKVLKVGNVNPSGNGMNGNVFSDDGLSPTRTTNKGEGNKILSNLRIRKLTPKECFRLMGFDDCDVDVLVKNGISKTQLYKMAGNSIVVDVLEEIFVELLNQYEDVFPYTG